MICIVAVVFLVEQQTESCRIIISSGVLSCGLDPFTGDGWRRKRAPSIRSLRWHRVFISPRHDSAEPNESFKIFIVGVTHLPHTPASRTDDARAPVSAFSRWRPRQERLGAAAPSTLSSDDEPPRIDFTVAVHP